MKVIFLRAQIIIKVISKMKREEEVMKDYKKNIYEDFKRKLIKYSSWLSKWFEEAEEELILTMEKSKLKQWLEV